MKIIDITKKVQQRKKEKLANCSHKFWGEEEGFEYCLDCNIVFPCQDNECEHFDCAEIQIEKGLRIDFPEYATLTITDSVGRVIFDNVFEEE